jgi:DNA-binding response OmpR family regulator
MVQESPKILIVDDQAEIRDLAETILSAEQYVVRTACDGQDALNAVFEESFDLVLLDINMPQMDGWETLRLMRADEALSGIPVVMFSIKGEIRDKSQGMMLGAVDYITKPFKVDELVIRVRQVLETTGGGRKAGAGAV